MTNPLARAVMKNIVGNKKDDRAKERISKKNVKSLDELAKGIKGEAVEVEEKLTENSDIETDKLVKTMSFSDIAKKAKGEPVKSTEYKVNSKSKRVTTQNLSELAKSIKGGGRKTSSKVSTKEEKKNVSFNDLLNNNKNIINKKSKDDTRVEDIVDSKDRRLISSLIDGNKKADETDVKSAKVLNLSQAVKSMINR